MVTLILTISLMGLLMLLMSVGLLLGGRSLRGSCGGVGKDCACEEAAQEQGQPFSAGSACTLAAEGREN